MECFIVARDIKTKKKNITNLKVRSIKRFGFLGIKIFIRLPVPKIKKKKEEINELMPNSITGS